MPSPRFGLKTSYGQDGIQSADTEFCAIIHPGADFKVVVACIEDGIKEHKLGGLVFLDDWAFYLSAAGYGHEEDAFVGLAFVIREFVAGDGANVAGRD